MKTPDSSKKSALQISFAVDVGGATDARSREALVARTADIVRQRMARLPMAISVTSAGETIQVTITPDEHTDNLQLDEARDVVGKGGRLAIHLVETADAHARALADFVRHDPAARAAGIEVGDDEWTAQGATRHEPYLTAANTTASFDLATARARDCLRQDMMVVGGKVDCRVTGRERLEQYLGRTVRAHPELAAADGFAFGFERTSSGHDPIGRRHAWRTHYLRTEPLAGNDAIASAVADQVPGAGWMAVVIQLTPEARARLEQAVHRNPGRKLAVVVDGVIVAAPAVETSMPKGTILVPVNEGSMVARQQAEILACALSAGPLPAALTRRSSQIVPL